MDVWTVVFTPDGRYLATGSHGGKINLYEIETGSKSNSFDTRGKFTLSVACVCNMYSNNNNNNDVFSLFLSLSLSQSPDNKLIACGAVDGIINLFDLQTGKLLHTLEGKSLPVSPYTLAPPDQVMLCQLGHCVSHLTHSSW